MEYPLIWMTGTCRRPHHAHATWCSEMKLRTRVFPCLFLGFLGDNTVFLWHVSIPLLLWHLLLCFGGLHPFPSFKIESFYTSSFFRHRPTWINLTGGGSHKTEALLLLSFLRYADRTAFLHPSSLRSFRWYFVCERSIFVLYDWYTFLRFVFFYLFLRFSTLIKYHTSHFGGEPGHTISIISTFRISTLSFWSFLFWHSLFSFFMSYHVEWRTSIMT
jgi:hypothetical protein